MNLINNLTKSAAMLSVITLLGQSFVLADPSIQLKGEFNGAWTSSSGDYSTTNEQEDGNLDIIFTDTVETVDVYLRLRQKADGSAQQNAKIGNSFGTLSFGDDDGAADPVDSKVPTIFNDSSAAQMIAGLTSDYKDGDSGDNTLTYHSPEIAENTSFKLAITKGEGGEGVAKSGDIKSASMSTSIAGIDLAFGTAMHDPSALTAEAAAFDSTFVTASTSLAGAKIGVGIYDSDYGDESMNIGFSMPISNVDFNMTYSEHDENTGHDPSGYMIALGKGLGFGDFTVEYHHADLTGAAAGEVDTWRLGYSISFGPATFPTAWIE
tara:strand:+ start:290 stop:1255 length:966 start_codon:yes stop_codon:yes gene_type:complete